MAVVFKQYCKSHFALRIIQKQILYVVYIEHIEAKLKYQCTEKTKQRLYYRIWENEGHSIE